LLGVCTVYGTVEPRKLITPGNAKSGDLILCTNPLGLETVTNFSLTHKEKAQELFGVDEQDKLSKLVYMQSCVKEALQLAQIEGVHAMHDATEGGFVAAINELAQASNVGFKVDWERLPISKEVFSLQSYFKLTDEQLLSMSSTGTILAAVAPEAQEKVKASLNKNELSTCFLGEFTTKKERTLLKKDKEMPFPQAANDPYAMILSGK
jgi:hydrogenase maturation factor